MKSWPSQQVLHRDFTATGVSLTAVQYAMYCAHTPYSVTNNKMRGKNWLRSVFPTIRREPLTNLYKHIQFPDSPYALHGCVQPLVPERAEHRCFVVLETRVDGVAFEFFLISCYLLKFTWFVFLLSPGLI